MYLRGSRLRGILAHNRELSGSRSSFSAHKEKGYCIVNIDVGVELSEYGDPDVPLRAPVLELIENS
jgi:hypothetical protein